MNSFRFALLDRVRVTASGEAGQVIGRAQYANARDGYLLRYRNALGQAVEQWWSDDALEPASSDAA